MSQSIARVGLHIVFSTKNRRRFLQPSELRAELFAYMAAVLKNQVNSPALEINGVEDHIHALIALSRRFAIMTVLQEMKSATSKWLKRQCSSLRGFSWQAGYGAFAVSESNIEQVRRYIQDQEQRHRRMTFKEEYRELCRRNGVPLDERYAWE